MLPYTKNSLSEEINRGIVSVGDYTYGKPNIISFDNSTNLEIGKFCSIASDVTIILGGQHRIDWLSTYPFPAEFEDCKVENYRTSKGAVTIGNDVWISTGATILSGATIGDGAVIGARAVIAKDVAPYSIVIGNPQREIRKRFDTETINRLLSIKWWDWDIRKIKEKMEVLCSDNLEKLKTWK